MENQYHFIFQISYRTAKTFYYHQHIFPDSQNNIVITPATYRGHIFIILSFKNRERHVVDLQIWVLFKAFYH